MPKVAEKQTKIQTIILLFFWIWYHSKSMFLFTCTMVFPFDAITVAWYYNSASLKKKKSTTEYFMSDTVKNTFQLHPC